MWSSTLLILFSFCGKSETACRVTTLLEFEVQTEEVGAWEGWTIDVACVAVDAFIDVLLE